MTTPLRRWRFLMALLAVFALFVAACGDDDDDAPADDAPTETDDGTDDGTDEGAAAEADVTVTLVDYGFEGLPAEVEAGTTFTVNNASENEIHEFVAVLIPEGEERSVDELLQLPEEELFAALFPAGPPEPATVLIQPPGSPDVIPAVGDGTLSDPGRYLIACFIPVGADPAEFMAAAETSEGPPDVGGGPPHFTQGMFAELTVTAAADAGADDMDDGEDHGDDMDDMEEEPAE